MALAAGLVEEHLASILSKFDKKDWDIVAQMKKIRHLLDVEIEKEILKLDLQMRFDLTVLNNLPKIF